MINLNYALIFIYLGGFVNLKNQLIIQFLTEVIKILLSNSKGRIRPSDEQRRTLVLLAKQIGRGKLKHLPCFVKMDTLMAWHRRLVKQHYDYSYCVKKKLGRPSISLETEKLIVKMARENISKGYKAISGIIENLGLPACKTTVANILKKHGIPPVPERKKTYRWHQFIQSHKHIIWATDFFSYPVLTFKGIVTYYAVIFIHLESRNVVYGGITTNPNTEWMMQIARNSTDDYAQPLSHVRYLIHDRDKKYCPAFDQIFKDQNIKIIKLPPQSPNLNAYAERFVKSIKEECLHKLILWSWQSLDYVIREYIAHYNTERNHQGIDNKIPTPDHRYNPTKKGKIKKESRLGGLLNYYYRKAA